MNELQEALLRLDVLEEFKLMARWRLPFPLVEEALAELLHKADRNYKRAALKAHPDHGGSEKAMQALNAAKDVIHSISVSPPKQYVAITIGVSYG